jgi:radical SAM enzyme (TIGR01210 family)
MDRHAEPIARAGEEVGKTYVFDEGHDPEQPAQWWFQDSEEGLVLFVVFYTQACRWSSCLGCNLPSKSSRFHVGFKALIAQVDHLFALPEVRRRLGEVRKFIVSNNGSVLDEETFSSTALMYLIARTKMRIPGLCSISLETRPEYVDLAELEFLHRALLEEQAGIALELAVGFEAFDDRIRNDVFRKGLELDRFEAFLADVAPFGFSVKCYFMQKPVPEMTDAAAIDDIRQAIDYLDRLAARYNLPLNMHLNPTYVASGTPLETCFSEGSYTPPKLMDVARAALHAKGKRLSVFLGLYDEGLAVPQGSFIRDGEERLIDGLEQFNRTQDFQRLEKLLNSSS